MLSFFLQRGRRGGGEATGNGEQQSAAGGKKNDQKTDNNDHDINNNNKNANDIQQTSNSFMRTYIGTGGAPRRGGGEWHGNGAPGVNTSQGWTK